MGEQCLVVDTECSVQVGGEVVTIELSCSVEMPALITIPIEVTQETRADSMGTGTTGTPHKYLCTFCSPCHVLNCT